MSDIQILLTYAVSAIWLVAAWRYPRHAVGFLLLWIPVQGWFQLTLFNDSSLTILIYEAQIIGIYLIFGLRALNDPARFGPPPAMWLALPFTIWALVLTPWSLANNGAIATVVGLRTLLLPLPLVWIGYRAFDDVQQLKSVGKLLMLELPLIAWVAATQFLGFVDPLRAVLNIPLGSMLVGGVIRPPGTFSAPGHLGMYVIFAVLLAIGLLGTKVTTRTTAIYAAGLVSATVALMVNTQRAAMVLLALTVPMTFLLAKKLRHVNGAMAIVIVLGVGGVIGSQVAGGAFLVRLQSISFEANSTVRAVPLERMRNALKSPLIGGGLGSASPGAGRLALFLGSESRTSQVQANPAESFMASLVFELGVPGLFLFYLFLAALLRAGFQSVRACRQTDLALLAAALFGFQVAILLMSWTYDPLHYPPSRVLFWVWAGVLLRLPHLAMSVSRGGEIAMSRPVSGHRQFARSPIPSVAGRGTLAAHAIRQTHASATSPRGHRR